MMNEAFWNHSLEILIMLLVAFLLGVLLGYILWHAYRQMHDDLLKEHNGLKERFLSLEKDHVSLKYKHDELEKDNNGLRSRVRSLEADVAVLETKLHKANEALQASQAGNTASSAAPTDDLTKIEGIGPKIAELLQREGIKTFATLAKTTPEKLKAILAAGGNRFQMHDPTSWPKQALLAAEGKWDELKTLQTQLTGGRE